MNSEELKREIIHAGRRAVEQLIKVAKEDIIKPDPDDELAADRSCSSRNCRSIKGERWN